VPNITNGITTNTKPVLGVDEHLNINCAAGYAVAGLQLQIATLYCLRNGQFSNTLGGSSLPNLNCVASK